MTSSGRSKLLAAFSVVRLVPAYLITLTRHLITETFTAAGDPQTDKAAVEEAEKRIGAKKEE